MPKTFPDCKAENLDLCKDAIAKISSDKTYHDDKPATSATSGGLTCNILYDCGWNVDDPDVSGADLISGSQQILSGCSTVCAIYQIKDCCAVRVYITSSCTSGPPPPPPITVTPMEPSTTGSVVVYPTNSDVTSSAAVASSAVNSAEQAVSAWSAQPTNSQLAVAAQSAVESALAAAQNVTDLAASYNVAPDVLDSLTTWISALFVTSLSAATAVEALSAAAAVALAATMGIAAAANAAAISAVDRPSTSTTTSSTTSVCGVCLGCVDDVLPAPPANAAYSGATPRYATEHIYEIQEIKIFFSWLLINDTKVSNYYKGSTSKAKRNAVCRNLIKRVFMAKSRWTQTRYYTPVGANSGWVVPIQDIYASLEGSYLSQNPDGEFVYLARKLNSMKEVFFSGTSPSFEAKYADTLDQVARAVLLARYLQDPRVINIYKTVSDRIRDRFVYFGDACRKANTKKAKELSTVRWGDRYDEWEKEYITKLSNRMNVFIKVGLTSALSQIEVAIIEKRRSGTEPKKLLALQRDVKSQQAALSLPSVTNLDMMKR
ncbi:hypothetical protein GGR52DRAFT_575269 [Hypoxylon sp. FL1284]|nr:hypothetical protein GGR52DRAFT_575269 [Hypoxylon sp. FL1284]